MAEAALLQYLDALRHGVSGRLLPGILEVLRYGVRTTAPGAPLLFALVAAASPCSLLRRRTTLCAGLRKMCSAICRRPHGRLRRPTAGHSSSLFSGRRGVRPNQQRYPTRCRTASLHDGEA